MKLCVHLAFPGAGLRVVVALQVHYRGEIPSKQADARANQLVCGGVWLLGTQRIPGIAVIAAAPAALHTAERRIEVLQRGEVSASTRGYLLCALELSCGKKSALEAGGAVIVFWTRTGLANCLAF